MSDKVHMAAIRSACAHDIGHGRYLAAPLLLAASVLLTSCAGLDGDACSDVANMSAGTASYNGCDGNVLSSSKQRETVYFGDDSPRLWTGEGERKGPVVNVDAINRAPGEKVGVPVGAYLGNLRVSYEPDPKRLGQDVINLQGSSYDPKINPDEKVAVKFEGATLDFFLKQMLGGALRVNYIAPDDIAGSVTIRTEQPVPKGQLLQIVRDVLARNGYEMRALNGVFQIGRPEALNAQESTSAAGRASEAQMRLVKIRKGSAQEVATFAKQLLPADVTLTPTNGGNAIVVRGPASELDKVSELLNSMADGEIGEDRVAIIPLRQNSPDKIAGQLNEFYRQRLGENGFDAVTIVPLEAQQSIMVGTRDRRMMEGVRQLVAQMDRNAADEMSLRVIPLVNLQAEETVRQLTAVFSDSAGGGGGAPAETASVPGGNRSGGGAKPVPKLPQQQDNSDNEDGSGSAPGFNLPGGLSWDQNGGNNGGGNSSGSQKQAARPAAVVSGSGGGVKLVADTRNNSIMVYSSYSTFKRIREVLAGLDVPQAQVVIEATVLEVQITDDLQYGVQWYLSKQGLAVRSGPGASAPADNGKAGGRIGVSTTVGDVKVDVVMNALQAVTKVKVISSPYLTVLDGKTARLLIGDQIPFATRTQQSNNTGNVTVTEEIQTKDTGIILEVTPRINSNNSVVLNVNQSVSKPQESAVNGNTTPIISTREMKSDIIVQSGRTVLLGGLIQDRIDKTVSAVPVVSRIPVVGNLFKQNQDTTSRVELIAMITPRVIRQSSQIENITRLLRGQTGIR